MRVYFDTSVLIAFLTQDALTGRADGFHGKTDLTIVVSDLAQTEFASAVSRILRTGAIDSSEARLRLSTLDEWLDRAPERVRLQPEDVAFADRAIRRLDLPLRTPDALHIAVASRVGAALATFDVQMAASARALLVTLYAV